MSRVGEGTQSIGDRPNEIPLPVPDAAEALGISPEAVRNRLSRGTLRSEKRDGKVYVLIDRDMVRHTERDTGDRPGDTSELVEALRQQIASLEKQLEISHEANRENRRIIAALTSRIPELEAPASPEPREPPESAPDRSDRGTTPEGAQEGAEERRRPWWRRLWSG